MQRDPKGDYKWQNHNFHIAIKVCKVWLTRVEMKNQFIAFNYINSYNCIPHNNASLVIKGTIDVVTKTCDIKFTNCSSKIPHRLWDTYVLSRIKCSLGYTANLHVKTNDRYILKICYNENIKQS